MQASSRAPRRLLIAVIAISILLVIAVSIVAISPSMPKSPKDPQSTQGTSQAGTAPPAPAAANTLSAEDAKLAEQITADIEPLLANKQFEEVARLAQAAIDRFPQHQRAHLLAAQAAIGLKQSAKAYEHLKSALAIGPENAELQTMAGTMASQVRLDPQAIEHFTRATILSPENPTPFMLLGAMYMRMPEASPAPASSAESSSETKALLNFRKASMLAPELATPYAAMAEISLRQNNLVGALAQIQKARELEPDRLSWRLIEARVHKRDNQPQKAIDLLINLPPQERLADPALPLLADSMAMLRRFEQAASLYEQAAQQSPNLSEEYLRRARELRQRAASQPPQTPATKPSP